MPDTPRKDAGEVNPEYTLRQERLHLLNKITREKVEAVQAGDFGRAANLRDQERDLQKELGIKSADGGLKPTGQYHVRIERPDGSHSNSSANTLHEAMDMHALRLADSMELQVDNVLLAATMLHREYHRRPLP